ncbi:MAG TPA: VWA domain-containing protein [Thermoanaerobaculia bacterium]|jgi:Ca-activated chloride channel family protein|nr:VWA domain-containing protein [Thermoanaerobaculia bacterium]
MNKIQAVLISALLVAVAAAAQTPPAQPDPQPAPAPAVPAPATPAPPPPDAKSKAAAPDQGVRKLSRRERKERIKNLSEKYRQFLNDVDPIMNPAELDTFLILETDPQREIYVTEFWRRRDVLNGTTNQSFRQQYYDRLETVKEEFTNASSDRGRIFLIHGAPAERLQIDCRLVQPAEIWKYIYIPNMGHDVRFLFFKSRNGIDYKLFTPLDPNAMADLVSSDEIGTDVLPDSAVARVFGAAGPNISTSNLELMCKDGDEFLRAVNQAQLNKFDLMRVFEPPPMNEEDVHKILRSVVLATPNAPPLAHEVSVQYPAKQGGRTDAELTILVPRSQLTVKEVNNAKLYSLDVTGEVLKDNQLFENYRYRFDYPGDLKQEKIAVVIDRFLRPADYMARIRIQDINSGAEAIVEKPITVPEIFDTPEQQKAKESATTALAKLQDDIESNTTRLRIVPLADDLLNGLQHIETIAYGDDIKAVEFYLDGRKVMTKRQPPYTLDLDMGSVPQLRHVRAVALGANGEPLTGDELTLNTGNDPFRVRIVSPRVAFKLHGRTRVEMAVNIPEGKKLDHLDLFLNDTKMASLYGPPYVQMIEIPAQEGVGYIRAVANLKEDAQPPVEDLVMINTPQFMEEVNVHLVELPTTVLRNGHPINDLVQDAFKVMDEGKPVKVSKFEHLNNLPLSIGLAIDTSASMQPRMAEAQKAAAQFFTKVMRKGDRAFLVSFDVQPQIIQRWSPQLADMNAGLAKLRAEESTALYDAIVYSLYNFLGVKGQRALVLVTDGMDTSSKFTFDQAIEYARRAAVPIYAIGLGIPMRDVDTRYKLSRFCSETGGNAYYIEQAAELGRIYTDIQNELRSQYILGFYPPDGVKPGSKWRAVDVQVSEGKAKTIRGYYP